MSFVSYDYWAKIPKPLPDGGAYEKPATLGCLVSKVLQDNGYLRRDNSDGEVVFTIPRQGKIVLRGGRLGDPAYILTVFPRGFPFVKIVERNQKLLTDILEKDGEEEVIKLTRVKK